MITRIFAFLFFVTSFSSFAQTSTITLKIDSKEASSGEVVCLNVSGSNFRRILSTQYSIQWDPAVLSYSGLTNFKLP